MRIPGVVLPGSSSDGHVRAQEPRTLTLARSRAARAQESSSNCVRFPQCTGRRHGRQTGPIRFSTAFDRQLDDRRRRSRYLHRRRNAPDLRAGEQGSHRNRIQPASTDFGRTSNAGGFRTAAGGCAGPEYRNTRAQVLLQVEQAYYNVLAADAVLNVAQARLEMQRVTLRQVRALAASSLKSTLDVSFAEVLVSEAELALYQAENAAKANRALLSAAIGDEKDAQFARRRCSAARTRCQMTPKRWSEQR